MSKAEKLMLCCAGSSYSGICLLGERGEVGRGAGMLVHTRGGAGGALSSAAALAGWFAVLCLRVLSWEMGAVLLDRGLLGTAVGAREPLCFPGRRGIAWESCKLL